ncbi:MAG: hypothetical protein A2X25_07545 [Chloroflexi bacterium GWB2_49_20]|nr:MAG: hypothetical protein A2X25_07545 [Chloroflexi bacterium GWB2_49_20]OGN78008.1 MAG: hypothetical protein A2X26_15350 [Chloroflexi bacterium GWC2_49_37]OGN85046.1 MAG: hypothetical protein A2X27_10050 [Chloroflexi bacterium GWD2_49_16]HBG74918.1 hypothetical protein [Anaerolineae bacterium]HCC78358.1 hypothetical protein [Anaerolineae bacterium]
MKQQKSISPWRNWLKPNRIIPLLTILVAGSTGILGIFNLVKISPVEGIIIALLALLAVDGLTERLSILEKIEAQLGSYTMGETLMSRSKLLPPSEIASSASEIAFVGVSGISIFVNHLGFFEQKFISGCKLRFILLDPESPSLQTWNLMSKVTTTETDIKSALELLKGLVRAKKAKGKCEIRLLKVYVPFGLLISDPYKDNGQMNVEFYTYKTTLSDRPHIQLSRTHDRQWFEFYVKQFEEIWSDSQEWTPK